MAHLQRPAQPVAEEAGKPPNGDGDIKRIVTTLAAALALTGTTQAHDAARDKQCPGARAGLAHYRQVFTTAQTAMGERGAPTFVRYGCVATKRRAVEWRTRARAAVRELETWRHYQYAWWDWMPIGWQNIGACETGYGKRPGRFDWNSGTYQGFAGFYHGSWDAFVGRADTKAGPYPSEAYLATPRQQYEVALAIYRAYGLSGWGCRGAFG